MADETIGRRTRAAVTRSLVVVVLALAVVPTALPVSPIKPAQAQDGFRVTYKADTSSPEQTRITGTVFNDTRSDALDVSVTAEALDAAGRVVARGVSYVGPTIPQRGSAEFVASVPAVPGVARFRVRVSSFRAGFGAQSP